MAEVLKMMTSYELQYCFVKWKARIVPFIEEEKNMLKGKKLVVVLFLR